MTIKQVTECPWVRGNCDRLSSVNGFTSFLLEQGHSETVPTDTMLGLLFEYLEQSVDRWANSLLQLTQDKSPIGLELYNPRSSMLVVLFENTTAKDDGYAIRVSEYRESGPVGHRLYLDASEALKEMVREGAIYFCPGQLDYLARLRTFQRGVDLLELKQRFANGVVPLDELETLNRKYA